MKKYLPICIIVLLSVVCLSIYGKDNKKEEFKTNTIKGNDNSFTIAAYINGVFSDTMPSESKYFGYVECRDNSGNKLDTLGFVEWENDKWNVRITDITKASTCNVYFIDPPAHWLDAEEGTLLKAIKDNNKVENVRSIPGKQINKIDEAVLSGTLDDYGTSYYFRGNVQNNYVQFANKCWKIVRITGDGNIKLFLWNNNGTDCSVNNSAGMSAFNEHYDYNAYIGFMYGNVESNEYSNATKTGSHDNIYDSTILTFLKEWYDLSFETENTTNYTALLADVIWCNDKSIREMDNNGSGISNIKTYYAITGTRTENPILKCPDAGLDGKISKYTAHDAINGNGALGEYKVGMLTKDELSYAGVADTANQSYYLKISELYWTMSPSYFSGTHSINWMASSRFIRNSVSQRNRVYPSIALNYNVQTTYDKTSDYAPGTVNNPYVISV